MLITRTILIIIKNGYYQFKDFTNYILKEPSHTVHDPWVCWQGVTIVMLNYTFFEDKRSKSANANALRTFELVYLALLPKPG